MLSPGHSSLRVYTNSVAAEGRLSGLSSQLRAHHKVCRESLLHNVCQEHAGVVWCVLWTATSTLNKLPLTSLQLRI